MVDVEERVNVAECMITLTNRIGNPSLGRPNMVQTLLILNSKSRISIVTKRLRICSVRMVTEMILCGYVLRRTSQCLGIPKFQDLIIILNADDHN